MRDLTLVRNLKRSPIFFRLIGVVFNLVSIVIGEDAGPHAGV